MWLHRPSRIDSHTCEIVPFISIQNELCWTRLSFHTFERLWDTCHHEKNSEVRCMDVSENSGFSPQIIHELRGFSIIFTIHFGGKTLFLGNTHMMYVVSHKQHASRTFKHRCLESPRYTVPKARRLSHPFKGYINLQVQDKKVTFNI